MRRILLAPLGSWGDVNPFLWIGRTLQSRGHEVAVVANPHFGPAIEKLGLRLIPAGTAEHFEESTRDPLIWHPRRGLATVFRYMGEMADLTCDLISDYLSQGEPPLAFAPSTAFGVRMAQQRQAFPLLTVHLQPAILLSVYDLPHFGPGLGFMRHMPLWMRRIFLALGKKRVSGILSPILSRACRDRGLQPPGNAQDDWWHSRDGVLNFFPEWFAPRQPDWPRNTTSVGFPLYDQADIHAPSPELEAFLSEGPKPVLFTPGSAMNQGAYFFKAATDACQAMGSRALFISRYPEQIPSDLPAGIRHFRHVPFGRVFGRCSAVVHHGGIGTTSQALAAGTPQLLMPMAHDQPDNAHRIKALGVGDLLYPSQFTPRNIRAALERLTTDGEIGRRCRAVHQKILDDQTEEKFLAAVRPFLQ